ncbi:BTB/POZ domain-containing protein 6-A [Pseudolycoriella hygida]|uniref:BTB/POZ domain-containing protein 6-A n=1 Tax=Pseudolycoriella hygida TaxID=35572 RepID=A0A9Q0NC81_9DIPT|nr:BTB/POZ domain-containing protein 6-A [Pseudolycoriella hygida]
MFSARTKSLFRFQVGSKPASSVEILNKAIQYKFEMDSNQIKNEAIDGADDCYDNPGLGTSVKKLYLNKKTADIFFAFDVNKTSVRLPAHKAIMSATSDAFDAMFYGELSEGNTVKIFDATIDGFKEFLQFFYMDKVKLTMKNIADVVKLSNMYLLESAPMICERFLLGSLSIENVCFGYALAIHFDLNNLEDQCENMIILNTNAVFQTDGFKECDKSVLRHILALETLTCSEIDLFGACMDWLKTTSETEKITRKIINEQLGNLFNDIRFGSMTLEQFSTLSSSVDGELFSGFEYGEIIQMIASNVHHSSNKFKKEPRQRPWNDENIVKCSRDMDTSGTSTYYFQDVESITFSSNKYILLGDIVCSQMHLDDKSLSANLLIIETPIENGISQIVVQQKITLYDSNQTVPLEMAIQTTILFRERYYHLEDGTVGGKYRRTRTYRSIDNVERSPLSRRTKHTVSQSLETDDSSEMNLPKRRSGKSQPTTIFSPKSISKSKEVSPSTSQNSMALPISANADEIKVSNYKAGPLSCQH